MARAAIQRLIVNSPYEEPARHWRYDRTTGLFDLADGRRDMWSPLRTQGRSTIPACSSKSPKQNMMELSPERM